MNPLLGLGGGIAALLLLGGVYAFGRHDGATIQIGKQAAVEAAVRKEEAKRQDLVDRGALAGAERETRRQASVKELYHETERVVVRPVYRNVCDDADGLRILDQAAAVANGEDPGRAAGGAGEAPTTPADR
ncbi:hypothetical protein S2M10_31540 [Sphingomonas sp. S2M10]|uniref:hypothetical protein n=1 Tax=Sphingomonas sp. S2M10 TaxID=2705010 RepID=UPI001457733F|nr:hypothetical protein [Sphingomonas sp. S2M10]NLS28145.1 hypothetical protein [Sphingomonas sp. S2M10]